MPAICAHPVIAVPLTRYNLCLSALIVGSMSPDFFYFFRVSHNAQFGHTLQGVFLFCLPVGLLVLWVFHRVLKSPLFSLLPQNHQERMIFRDAGFSLLVSEHQDIERDTVIICWDIDSYSLGFLHTFLRMDSTSCGIAPYAAS